MSTFGKRETTKILIVLLALVSLAAGCGDTSNQYAQIDVPQPVNLLLPKSINIHPFTKTRTFDQAGGIRGVNVTVVAFNAFHEATKAFGSFRFEVHTFQSNNLEPKGKLRGIWEVEPSLLDPRENLRYWNRSQQMYEFKLQWDKPIPVGRKFVLVAVFTSPFTQRLTAQRIFTSGE